MASLVHLRSASSLAGTLVACPFLLCMEAVVRHAAGAGVGVVGRGAKLEVSCVLRRMGTAIGKVSPKAPGAAVALDECHVRGIERSAVVDGFLSRGAPRGSAGILLLYDSSAVSANPANHRW
jgi:hypothetical protein